MIGQWRLAETAQRLGARLLGGDAAFYGVVTDSRAVKPGDLFVALRGERFDGHDFLSAVQAAGAVAAIVDRPVPEVALAQLVVADTVSALGALGQINRERFEGRVMAVTGSQGKTTVKELSASILSELGPVCWTEGNLNNHLGVPRTLLRLESRHQFAVIELGANHVGEIAQTVALTRPQVSVLNNATDAHLEGFGGPEGIARAKGEIIEGLAADGVAILNRESPWLSQWVARAAGRTVVTFGMTSDADVRAEDLQMTLAGCAFLLQTPAGESRVRLPLPGRHNVMNALAAAAATLALGASLAQVVTGLEKAQGVSGRLRILKLPEGGALIDDTYNASPGSVKAALDVIGAGHGHRIAVLGRMAELGDYAEACHREVGAYARGRVDELLVMGEWAKACCEGFAQPCTVFESHEAIVEALRLRLTGDTIVLVKGSRSAAMERVVAGLVPGHGESGGSH